MNASSLVPKYPFDLAQTTQLHLFDSRNPQRRTLKLSKYETNYHDNSDSNQPSTIGDRCHRRRFHDLEAVPNIRDRYVALGDRLLRELATALDA